MVTYHLTYIKNVHVSDAEFPFGFLRLLAYADIRVNNINVLSFALKTHWEFLGTEFLKVVSVNFVRQSVKRQNPTVTTV